jgi:hypothetical protein
MKKFSITSCALSVCLSAFLAGCGGSQPPIGAPGAMAQTPAIAAHGGSREWSKLSQSFSHHETFHYTGEKQIFKVPAGVTSIAVVALGAAGGGTEYGRGGRVYAVIPVAPKERIAVFVGGAGSDDQGGFNGGGSASGAYGGGGASDVREGGSLLRNRALVAGAGGGQGYQQYQKYVDYGGGGKGGGSTGGSGVAGWCHTDYTSGCEGFSGGGGGGGSQTQGGAGGLGGSSYSGTGNSGKPGERGLGGAGGSGCQSYSCGYGGSGGGAGAGYYGGGGGGVGAGAETDFGGGGGGGGGSSYCETSARTCDNWQGWKTATGNGLVVISW